MPGSNCCLPGCTVSRSIKHKDITLFRIPIRTGDFYKKWRQRLLAIITQYRDFDKDLKERLSKGNIYICENHFLAEDIELTKTGRKSLRLEALPTVNLPIKSHEKEKKVPRRHISIVKDIVPQKLINYSNLIDLQKKTQKLKLSGWEMTCNENNIKFKKLLPLYLLPKYEVVVDDSLAFTIIVFGWLLPDTHLIYKLYSRSMLNTTVTELLCKICTLRFCSGIIENIRNINNDDFVDHIVPMEFDLESASTDGMRVSNERFKRAKSCIILHTSESDNINSVCSFCTHTLKKNKMIKIKKQHQLATPALRKAPLSKTNPVRVLLALKQERLRCAQLTSDLEKINFQIDSKGITIDDGFVDDLNQIMSSNYEKATPFMKLFWDQQKKMCNKNFGSIKYHPMIIRFCLSLASKSASAYDELRSSNVLTLPSRRTLRDYKNFIRPKAGLNPPVIEELNKISINLVGYQRYVTLSFDEVKIQEKLVFNKHTGDIIGFVDLGEPDLYSTFQKEDSLASHVLVYFIRGIASDLKFALCHFATKGLTSFQLMPTFWEAVGVLELTCKLYVIAAVSDGAAPNRKFYRMHSMFDDKLDCNVVHRCINIYAPERYLWFFADAPHLIKTARNCLYHSGDGRGTRSLWNDGQQLIWYHITRIVNDEMKNGLKIIPKLTQDHIKLSAYSVMNVRLAAQVLSSSVSNILKNYYPDDTNGTAKFCEMLDSFFDCLNVRNSSEGIMKPNHFYYHTRMLMTSV
ncbi:uncharacterized protein LOC105850424 [Hydra vulgaris]|uniref:uncharacterized protein LOC105850424 n=1 Tax=Hydra vulgaris TaxID=6087 RepID=UPI001F5EC25E|nr:uncharacterized protein LOC105850424 [Hydra vulgaris]